MHSILVQPQLGLGEELLVALFALELSLLVQVLLCVFVLSDPVSRKGLLVVGGEIALGARKLPRMLLGMISKDVDQISIVQSMPNACRLSSSPSPIFHCGSFHFLH